MSTNTITNKPGETDIGQNTVVTGSISASAGTLGVTTNSNAAAGVVGEYISSVGTGLSSFSGSTGVWTNITSISLTAGDWDVESMVTWSQNGGSAITRNQTAVSVNSGTTTTDQVIGINQVDGSVPTAAYNVSQPIPRYRLSLSTTTTVYLKGNSSFSVAQPQIGFSITARRVR